MTVNSFFCKLYQSNLRGKDIDSGMLVILGNVLSVTSVQSIRLDNINQLKVMITDADKYFMLIDFHASYFCACYNYTREI